MRGPGRRLVLLVRLRLSLIILRRLRLLLLLVILDPLPLVKWGTRGLGHLLLSHRVVGQLLLLVKLVGARPGSGRSCRIRCLVWLKVWVRRGIRWRCAERLAPSCAHASSRGRHRKVLRLHLLHSQCLLLLLQLYLYLLLHDSLLLLEVLSNLLVDLSMRTLLQVLFVHVD